MKKVKYLIIILLFLFISCRLSTNQLATEVKYSMEQTWQDENITGISIKSLVLTHIQGNEYSGLLETIEDDGNRYKYSVIVVYDGENFQWQIIE